jgi:hypothetical protein
MDQEHEDYADPRPPPRWFELATHKGTIAVVCVAVLLAIARGLYLSHAIAP